MMWPAPGSSQPASGAAIESADNGGAGVEEVFALNWLAFAI
jgi:hypothetical protein